MLKKFTIYNVKNVLKKNLLYTMLKMFKKKFTILKCFLKKVYYIQC